MANGCPRPRLSDSQGSPNGVPDEKLITYTDGNMRWLLWTTSYPKCINTWKWNLTRVLSCNHGIKARRGTSHLMEKSVASKSHWNVCSPFRFSVRKCSAQPHGCKICSSSTGYWPETLTLHDDQVCLKKKNKGQTSSCPSICLCLSLNQQSIKKCFQFQTAVWYVW